MGDRGKAFAALLHHRLMVGQAAEVADLAAALGMTYHTFYARLQGRTPFSADEIRALLHQLPHADLVRYFTDDTDLLVLDRQDLGAVDQPPSLQDGAVRTIIEATDILEAVHDALADGKLDHIDRGRIVREVDACERALAGVRALVEQPPEAAARPSPQRPPRDPQPGPDTKDRTLP